MASVTSGAMAIATSPLPESSAQIISGRIGWAVRRRPSKKPTGAQEQSSEDRACNFDNESGTSVVESENV